MEPAAEGRPPGDAPAVRLAGITKRFGTVLANDGVDLSVAPGTIHGIVGENGAGKSTLMSILSGHYAADAGTVTLFGEEVRLASAADALARGIGMVHQHFMLVPNFTVVENLMLALADRPLLAASEGRVRARLADFAARHDLAVDPDAVVETLPVGLQQRVEILKALMRGGRILILDEPTGVLTPDETDRLFVSLRGLEREGVTILFITHKLREIMALTDAVSVMRGGRMVAHRRTADTDPEELAALMVGRTVRQVANVDPPSAGEAALVAEGLGFLDAGGTRRLSDVSLTLAAGEIVGLAGVVGNGQSELLAVLAGLERPSAGRFTIAGRTIGPDAPSDPEEMRALGLAHVPEDRRRQGLVLSFEARENAVLGYPEEAVGRRRWLLSRRRMRERCAALMARFDVRPPDPRLRAAGFSGGNQQKLVMAREVGAAPRVLLVGQPTRGVDIGAIAFIHARLLELRAAGCAILLVSVELDEILALSDRIVAMNAGRIVGEVARAEADRRTVGLMMAGVPPEAAGRAVPDGGRAVAAANGGPPARHAAG